jgi:hypothetical protein
MRYRVASAAHLSGRMGRSSIGCGPPGTSRRGMGIGGGVGCGPWASRFISGPTSFDWPAIPSPQAPEPLPAPRPPGERSAALAKKRRRKKPTFGGRRPARLTARACDPPHTRRVRSPLCCSMAAEYPILQNFAMIFRNAIITVWGGDDPIVLMDGKEFSIGEIANLSLNFDGLMPKDIYAHLCVVGAMVDKTPTDKDLRGRRGMLAEVVRRSCGASGRKMGVGATSE